MSYPLPLSKDHKILENEYCSGYIDTFGKWNTGFYCPQMESTTASSCCGTPTFKYCCTMRQGDEDDINELTPFLIRPSVVVGIIAGVTLVLLFITVASCFLCSCCFVYKKRRAHLSGGLYRMQCSSSTASGLVNMYSPSSTSNHNSLVTTPLDMEWSQQNHHRDHLITLPSSTGGGGANCHNGYPASTIANGFPHNLHHQNNNYSHITLPRYQPTPPPPRPPPHQNQNHHLLNNLPPPVFYPQNHLGNHTPGTGSNGSGAPYSLTSSNSSNYGTTPRPQNQYQNHNYHPNLTLSSISGRTPQNLNQRVPTSILRVTNYSSATLPPANSFNSHVGPPGTNSGSSQRPSSEIIINGHPHPHPHPPIMTLGRRNSSGGTLQPFGTTSNSFSSAPGGMHLNHNQKPPTDRSNFCVGGNGEVSESLSSSCNTASHPSTNRSRPVAINCQTNFQRLTACLSSSDSQHQGLHASAL